MTLLIISSMIVLIISSKTVLIFSSARTYGLSILSPDDEEGSCHSSRISNKSEKNMADFDGEEGLSEEELAQINAHVRFNQPTPHMNVLYHPHGRGTCIQFS